MRLYHLNEKIVLMLHFIKLGFYITTAIFTENHLFFEVRDTLRCAGDAADALPTFPEFSALVFPTVSTCYSLPRGLSLTSREVSGINSRWE